MEEEGNASGGDAGGVEEAEEFLQANGEDGGRECGMRNAECGKGRELIVDFDF